MQTAKMLFHRDHETMTSDPGALGFDVTWSFKMGTRFLRGDSVTTDDGRFTYFVVVYEEPWAPVIPEREFRFCLVPPGHNSLFPSSEYIGEMRLGAAGDWRVYLDLDERSFLEKMREEHGPRWGTREWVEEFKRRQGAWERGEVSSFEPPDAH